LYIIDRESFCILKSIPTIIVTVAVRVEIEQVIIEKPVITILPTIILVIIAILNTILAIKS
jgi:hypothetical protein